MFREQGFDILVMEWYGLLAPAGTPKPIIAKLSAEMRRILALPEVAERLAAIEMLGSSPEELGTFIRGEIDRWTPIIKKLGIKPDAAVPLGSDAYLPVVRQYNWPHAIGGSRLRGPEL